MPGRKDVESKVGYARRRATDLERLNRGVLDNADPDERQQLVQEFFFHLCGAVDLVAQVINEQKKLGIRPDRANARRVLEKLKKMPTEAQLHDALNRLYFDRSKGTPPAQAFMYTNEGFVYRMWGYRHQVTHRWQNPFALHVGGTEASVTYKLDPLQLKGGDSELSVSTDNQSMLGRRRGLPVRPDQAGPLAPVEPNGQAHRL